MHMMATLISTQDQMVRFTPWTTDVLEGVA